MSKAKKLSASRRAELMTQYMSIMHAVQSGVAQKMEIDPSECTPKHLRVGVDSAMVGNGALVKVLVKAGLISEEDFLIALIETANDEKKLYEKFLSDYFKAEITLA